MCKSTWLLLSKRLYHNNKTKTYYQFYIKMVVPRSKINKEAKISIKFRNLGFIYIKIIF